MAKASSARHWPCLVCYSSFSEFFIRSQNSAWFVLSVLSLFSSWSQARIKKEGCVLGS